MKTSTFQRVFSVLAGAALALVFQGQLVHAQTLKGDRNKQMEQTGTAIATPVSGADIPETEPVPVAFQTPASTVVSPSLSQIDSASASALLPLTDQDSLLLSQEIGQPTLTSPVPQQNVPLPAAGDPARFNTDSLAPGALPGTLEPGPSPADGVAPAGRSPGTFAPAETTTQAPAPFETTPTTPTTPGQQPLSPSDPGTPGTTPITPTDPSAPGTTPVTPFEPAPAPTPAPTTPLVQPGRATRSGPSYIGVGGNIGLGEGDTALGEGSFAVFSKIGLTRNLSVRPTVLFSDDPTILVPITFDFIPGITDLTEDLSEEVGLRVSPFIGPGIAISTGDDGSVDFLLSAGVDVPITRQLTATASVNASFFDNVAVGLLLGIGINF